MTVNKAKNEHRNSIDLGSSSSSSSVGESSFKVSKGLGKRIIKQIKRMSPFAHKKAERESIDAHGTAPIISKSIESQSVVVDSVKVKNWINENEATVKEIINDRNSTAGRIDESEGKDNKSLGGVYASNLKRLNEDELLTNFFQKLLTNDSFCSECGFTGSPDDLKALTDHFGRTSASRPLPLFAKGIIDKFSA